MHILDTGPIFKFLTTDCVPELLLALGHHKVLVPEAVEFEISNTPKRHPQFRRASEVWPKIPPRFKEVLSDAPTDELRECCKSVLGLEFEHMYAQLKDRGENMAILHGVLLARAGHKVLLVCDEEAGTAMIKNQQRALAMQQLRRQHTPGGSIRHADTLQLLRWAIENGGFKNDMQVFLRRYQAMAALDSALPRDVKDTGLTKSPPWP
ncbi:hypothetical protein [Corynebacterium pseudopelargi]|uniref:PIN domain-containing protein n=1 Tax=Corynebacterium pseudopelargi TaxID=2080757 RepID=A0A3G6J0K9_9CORY|nr:hypothetical protein [Corynebacterium pseudopelargi]AZA09900.1 hypothetical protein CPPEL_08985 [Corynebacterium pseudopelargi]